MASSTGKVGEGLRRAERDVREEDVEESRGGRRNVLCRLGNMVDLQGKNGRGMNTFNSLTAMGGRDRPPFNELRARVVSPRIFVRCQRLMARKIAELFGLNRGV